MNPLDLIWIVPAIALAVMACTDHLELRSKVRRLQDRIEVLKEEIRILEHAKKTVAPELGAGQVLLLTAPYRSAGTVDFTPDQLPQILAFDMGRRCPKCDCTSSASRCDRCGSYPLEHLHRECYECKWQWVTRTRDAS